MAHAKKIRREDDDETQSSKPAYIDWQEFNRLQKAKGVPRPEEDSPDDEGTDELEEATLGVDYPEEPEEDSVVLADTPSAARDIDNLLEDQNTEDTAPSSERPDPRDDNFADSDTH